MNISDLIGSPDWFLQAFEPPHAVFAEMDRGAYNRSIFCDMRLVPKSTQRVKAPLGPLCDYFDSNAPKMSGVSYIFHVAHCGSTLLARGLDQPGKNIVYREPMSLRQLAVEHAAASGANKAAWEKKLKLVTGMLDRRYEKDGPSIVKANVPVNFIVPELLAAQPDTPSIVLFFPMEHYLMAIMRSPNHRNWVAHVVMEMQREIAARVPMEKNMTVAQAAAALWLAQISIYHEAITRHPSVASLNAEDLFETPDIALANASRHFGQPMDEATIAGIVGSELFARYSKNPKVAFDNDARLARREALRQELAPELKEARAWIEKATAKNPLPDRLGNPLIGDGPELMMSA